MNLTTNRREATFSALYEQHYGAIHAYASRRVGPNAADEVTAETFLVAWRRFDAVPATPLPWLFGVARNVVLRQQGKTHRETLARKAAQHEHLSPLLHEEADDPAVWEAWDQLRPSDREVLALIAWEELTVAEAARVLGCAAPRFSVRLFRARRRLERLLAARGAPFNPTEV